MSDQLNYSRKQVAQQLSLSLSTVDVMIGRGMLRVRRQGRRVLIPAAEVEKFAKRDVPQIWPSKVDGKTVRVSQ